MFQVFARVLRILNSETDPGQISLALCLAMVMGFTPLFSLHNVFVLLLVCILRVNIASFLLGLAFFTALSFILDPLFHRTGLFVLQADLLHGIWTSMYNTTFWRLEHFYNSIVMGSLVLSLILFIPLYFLLNYIIRKYRENILAWMKKTKLVQAISASKFYDYYRKASSLGGLR